MKILYQYILSVFILFTISSNIYSQPHSIISYNIRYDNNWDIENSWKIRRNKISQILVQYSPSIIGIQEGLLNQVQYIDSSLIDYDYVGVGRDDGKKKGEFCAIYFDTTRYVLLKNSTFWLSETPDTISVGWDAALERICTYGLFKDRITKEELLVFNTHFDHIGVVAREKSSELILKRINKINHRSLPVILMGDFNSIPNSSPVKEIKTELSDALQISLEKLQGPRGTFNGFNEDLPIEKRIDYIFTNDLKVLSYTHINDRLNNNRHISDHLPVMIKIQ
ncbi:MAG: endonuclease/exonuclease/phosphatase family protein [Candidatus Marinimicrobia bacterium]|nr:endonuclease/exonuclease/phosphatase family protein [Candidatus Neomarinimicrobiota bacterium]